MAARVLTDDDLEPLRREIAELREQVRAASAVQPDLTVEAAAGVLGVAPKTIRRWAREGRIRAIRRGREWRIPRAALALPPDASPETAAEAALAALPRPLRTC